MSAASSARRPVESRFEALHGAGLTALAGREEEVDLLLRRWVRAQAGEGQVVLVSGEAGIGKSRLTAALLERLCGEPHTRLRYFCSLQHTDSAFHPIIGQLERAAGFAHDDTPQAKLDKLDALLSRTATPGEDAALLADLLSLPGDGRHPALDLDAQQRRQRTLQALDAQVQALARAEPVLTVFEEAHWSDPTSLEAFGRRVDRIATLRALLIVTHRPEFETLWIGRPHAMILNRLAPRDIGALIDRMVGNKLLPAAMRADIVERTDGVPLFVEEMKKAVLEAESEGEARRTAAAVPSQTSAVPASPHASLMARLDRLGAAKEVAQIGAAIGREVSHALLVEVAANLSPQKSVFRVHSDSGYINNTNGAVFVIAHFVITCPKCRTEKRETMPMDACQFFYECTSCGALLRPEAEDCCVFCSYGDVPCPPIQESRASGAEKTCCR